MKLSRNLSGTFAVMAVALACGCSSAPRADARAPAVAASDASTTGTTSLMSAELPTAPPRIGKSELGEDAAVEAPLRDGRPDTDDAPKDVRRPDGSRRGGGFGNSK